MMTREELEHEIDLVRGNIVGCHHVMEDFYDSLPCVTNKQVKEFVECAARLAENALKLRELDEEYGRLPAEETP